MIGNDCKDCIVFHCWYFKHGFKFKKSVCDSCHDLFMLCLNISDTIVISVKDADYGCIILNISKSDAIHLLEKSVFDDRWYV